MPDRTIQEQRHRVKLYEMRIVEACVEIQSLETRLEEIKAKLESLRENRRGIEKDIERMEAEGGAGGTGA